MLTYKEIYLRQFLVTLKKRKLMYLYYSHISLNLIHLKIQAAFIYLINKDLSHQTSMPQRLHYVTLGYSITVRDVKAF